MAGADFAKQVQMLVYVWQNASKRKAGGQAGSSGTNLPGGERLRKECFFIVNIHKYKYIPTNSYGM